LVHAVRAFVLDWYATGPLTASEEREDLLTEAQNSALRAYQLDHDNALALAYYAEVLLDQQNWSQAEQYASQAVMDPNSMVPTGCMAPCWNRWASTTAPSRIFEGMRST
jgi:hypothetical protein